MAIVHASLFSNRLTPLRAVGIMAERGLALGCRTDTKLVDAEILRVIRRMIRIPRTSNRSRRGSVPGMCMDAPVRCLRGRGTSGPSWESQSGGGARWLKSAVVTTDPPSVVRNGPAGGDLPAPSTERRVT